MALIQVPVIKSEVAEDSVINKSTSLLQDSTTGKLISHDAKL